MTPAEWLNSAESVERSKKPYAHFDWRTDIGQQREYIADPNKVTKHGFYPFIHYKKRTLKYNKKKGKKEKYNLEEIQEYVELSEKYSALETDYSNAQQRIEDLESQIATLTEFKNKVDRAEKQKMIDSFSVLSDEEKKDVVENIDKYSLDDIEAKLSIICVRNKVSFNLEDDNSKDDPTVFNLNGNPCEENVPAWVKALRRTVAEN